MKVFVTGGTGFIGTHFIEKFQQTNHEICLLVLENEQIPNSFSKNIKTISGNLSNIEKWKDKLSIFSPDVIVHLAWMGIPDYSYKTSILNLKYGIDLFTTIAEIGCKSVICTGTCWEYGRKRGLLNEDMTPISDNSFTAAKNSLYAIGKEIFKENDMNFIWTRLFYVYGPLQRSYSLIPYVINSIIKGKKLEIKSPWNKNDFIFISDVVDGLQLILEKCKSSALFNIGSGISTSVNDIVKIVCDNFNYHYEPSQSLVHDDNIDFWADISKIKKIIGWKPNTSIESGIGKMVDFFKNKTEILAV